VLVILSILGQIIVPVKPLLFLIGIFFLVSCHSPKPNPTESPKNVYYEQAYDFLDKNEIDSSFVYFEKAREEFVKNNDSLGAAQSLINMAVSQLEYGDYYGSQETSTQALEFLNLNDTSQYSLLAMVYGNLSTIYDYLKNPKQSLESIQLAIKYAKDPANKRVYENNLANAYLNYGKPKEAVELLKDLLNSSEPNSKDYARFITNYARAKTKLDSNYNPLPEFKKGLSIRKKLNDRIGLNSSYTHLMNYFKNRNIDSALFYSQMLLDLAEDIKNPDVQMDALKSILNLTVIDKNKALLRKYHHIEDSVEIARLSAKNQFALIRYEVEKSKTDNLKLSNEIAEKQYRLNLTIIFLLAILIIVGLSAYYIWSWYKRKKQRLKLEADNRVKESQLKTSRKVHDVVANGIYRVMAELENRDDIDREELLDRLEIMYDKSRDISYEVEEEGMSEVPFHLQVSELLKSFSNDCRTILIAGNDQTVWDLFNAKQKGEIEQILQELMVNMRKHSGANEVIVRFEHSAENLNIFYKDDGVGLADSIKYGNGIKNTENRINLLKGTLTFEKNNNNGLGIHISIPAQN